MHHPETLFDVSFKYVVDKTVYIVPVIAYGQKLRKSALTHIIVKRFPLRVAIALVDFDFVSTPLTSQYSENEKGDKSFIE